MCRLDVRERFGSVVGLYDLTATRLVRLATAITRNQHDAEDAVGTALVRVADDVHLLLRAKHPWAYLLQMVRNEALLILRRKKRWNVVNNITDLLTRRTSINWSKKTRIEPSGWPCEHCLPSRAKLSS